MQRLYDGSTSERERLSLQVGVTLASGGDMYLSASDAKITTGILTGRT